MAEPLIRMLRLGEAQAAIPSLAEVLIDCVQGGASTGFMADINMAQGVAFWTEIVEGIEQGRIVLVVGEDEQGICGTVYMTLAERPSQRHRAHLSKLLVHRRARGNGVAKGMLNTLESTARALGRALLLIATKAESPGEQLCIQLGWTEAGFVPNYSLNPDGSPADAAFYYKSLV